MTESLEVAIARLEGKVDSLRAEVSSQKEAVAARVDAQKERTDQEINLVREKFNQQERTNVRLGEEAANLRVRMDTMERWQNRTVGIAIGSALGGGSIAGLIIRALGS